VGGGGYLVVLGKRTSVVSRMRRSPARADKGGEVSGEERSRSVKGKKAKPYRARSLGTAQKERVLKPEDISDQLEGNEVAGYQEKEQKKQT